MTDDERQYSARRVAGYVDSNTGNADQDGAVSTSQIREFASNADLPVDAGEALDTTVTEGYVHETEAGYVADESPPFDAEPDSTNGSSRDRSE
jgi:hypothetical protein